MCYIYNTHNNKWNLSVVCASLNRSTRVAKSFIFCVEYHNKPTY